MVNRMTDAPVPLEEHVPTADQFVMLNGTWHTYQALLDARGERRNPRIAYLDGVIELMSPSRDHDGIRYALGYLIGEYCMAKGIPFSGYGAWTQESPHDEAGLEPDECFVFDEDPLRKDRPDLAIEVIWTSGGIKKLEIYRRLGIREVWFWNKEVITAYVLGGDGYARVERSAQLSELDLAWLARLATITPVSAAIRELRDTLRRPDGT